MAYRNKQPRHLNFSGLLAKHRIDNPILIESQRGEHHSQSAVYPQLGGGPTTNTTDTAPSNFESIAQELYPSIQENPAIEDDPTATVLFQHSPPKSVGTLSVHTSSRNLAQSIISRRTKTNPPRQFSVDSNHSSILLSHSPSSIDPPFAVCQSPTSQRLAFPGNSKRAYSTATVKFATPDRDLDSKTIGHSPKGPRSKLSYSECESSSLVDPTPSLSGSSPSNSRPYRSNHSLVSTPVSDIRPSLYSISPQNYCKQSPTSDADSAISSPISYLAQRRPNLSSSHSQQQLAQSVSSLSTDLRPPTGSSSRSSISRNSIDHNLQLVSPGLNSPWPVPPSSAHAHAPFPSGWPKKSATYYPLRTWSNAPRPHPSVLASARSPSSALAYLDLSPSPMPLATDHSTIILPNPSLETSR
jgi:hypothetical protein